MERLDHGWEPLFQHSMFKLACLKIRQPQIIGLSQPPCSCGKADDKPSPKPSNTIFIGDIDFINHPPWCRGGRFIAASIARYLLAGTNLWKMWARLESPDPRGFCLADLNGQGTGWTWPYGPYAIICNGNHMQKRYSNWNNQRVTR